MPLALIVNRDGSLACTVLTASAENIPNLDGENLLGTHALLSARESVNQTIGITCTNGVQNPLHVQLADSTNLGYMGANGETRNIVKITDDYGSGTFVDQELLNSTTDNLDGKQALVVEAVLFGRDSSTGVFPIRINTVGNDAVSSTAYALQTLAHNYGFNGTNFDRHRCRTSDGGDQNNSTIGCQIVINLNYVWDAGNTKWVPMTQP